MKMKVLFICLVVSLPVISFSEYGEVGRIAYKYTEDGGKEFTIVDSGNTEAIGTLEASGKFIFPFNAEIYEKWKSSGEICKHDGHDWAMHSLNTVYLSYPGQYPPETRSCSRCDLMQTEKTTPPVWVETKCNN